MLLFGDFVAEAEGRRRSMTLYHGVRDPAAAAAIVSDGFRLEKIKPQWQNDYAISTLTTEHAVESYFGTDRPLTVLSMAFRGTVVDYESLGYVTHGDARSYTREILARGIDAVTLSGSGARQVFVYNVRSVSSIKVVKQYPAA